ncbi:ankyrin [Colletotrichum sublineola]|nr:ankyrin [Colletotrichum sublineola]
MASPQARHKREDSKVTDFVQGMLEKYPKMRRRSKRDPGFAYQGIENDRLFKASYNHVHGPACQDCSAAGEVQRDARDSTDSEIHYGIIASGNTLVKDAAARDQIVDNIGEDCLCFEMEAAGLMNEFPCLVIRGVCDYADSHKNDQWQQYASATAAAYGKELLLYVPVMELRETKRALDVLKSFDLKIDHLKQTTFETKAAVPPDPSTNANHARKLRHEGTGMWLLEHPVFQSWCTGSRRYSWLHGLAGCGKTILSTTVLDHLTSKKDGRNHENGGREPATKAISDAVCEMLATSTEVCIVLDALNESTSRRELLKWIEDVAARPDLAHVQLLCTARPEPEFLVRFDRMMGKESCISLDKTAVNTDIQAYVAEQLATRWEFQEKPLSPNLIQEIVAKVGGGADGMNLPKDLEETYKRMLSNIPKRDKDNAIRLLQFLVHTRRPLMLGEAIEILVTDTGAQQPGFDKESRVFGENEVLGHCPSLMAIVEVTERIHLFEGGLSEGKLRKELHLAHFSVKEYLRSAEWFDTYTSSVTITKTCLTYLRGISGNHRTIENDYPFAKLAAEIWTSHAASSQSCEEVFQASLAFIEQEVTFRRWCHLHQPDWESYEWRPPPRGSRFYYACLEGLTRVAHELMRGGVEVNAEGGYYNNALQAASVGGHDDVVKLLLDNGADPNKKGGIYGNTRGSHDDIVKLLLERGADVNTRFHPLEGALKAGETDIVEFLLDNGSYLGAKGCNCWSLLQTASEKGNTHIVKLVLDKLTDFGAQSGNVNNALHAAHTRNFSDIAKMLLKRVANTTAEGNRCGFALEIASERGFSDIVKLLLERGSDLGAQSAALNNALQAAHRKGFDDIVEMLVERGATRS